MKAQLNDYFCSDIPEVWKWVPDDPHNVYSYMQLMIGGGPEGSDTFGLTVCTPQALSMRRRTFGQASVSRRHLFVVYDYSWNAVLQYVNDVIDKCQGMDWNEVSSKLARHFYWEFEDYRP